MTTNTDDDAPRDEDHPVVIETMDFACRILQLAEAETSGPGVAIIALGEALACLVLQQSDGPKELRAHKARVFQIIEEAIAEHLRQDEEDRKCAVRPLQPCEVG